MTKFSILLTLLVATAFGQEMKLAKLLGPDFKSIPVRRNNPYMETAPGCEIIPSATIKGDTSGLVSNKEYLLFRNYEAAQKRIAAYVKTSFVSNAEYQEFQNWVRDSIAREKIIRYDYYPIESVLKFLVVSPKDLEEEGNIDMRKLRKKYKLNWETPFKYNDPQWMPVLADMYMPQPERFFRFRDFDKRKLTYQYTIPLGEETLELHIPTINHAALWANKSVSVNDEYAVLGQKQDQLVQSSPVIGLTGIQANAFCHWKEVQLQQELNKKGFSYKVRVTLPVLNELTEIDTTLAVPERNYTLQWRITVVDYQAFMQAVKDSILTEHLFYKLQESKETRADALKLISYKEQYFNERSLKFGKVPPSDYELCRYLYPLKKDPKIFKKYKEEVLEIEIEMDEHLNLYKYERIDIAERSIVGKLRVEKMDPNYHRSYDRLEVYEINSVTQERIGMDLDLGYINRLMQCTGVRDHENYARFRLHEFVKVTPKFAIEQQKPEDLVKGITYEQALAYYHWKYPIWKAKHSDDWQNFVYPNEDQFKRIQNGEQIKIPEHQLNYPSPVFRYVVSFSTVK